MINNITTYLFNHENMLITVLSFKLHIKLFKLSKLKMSLSLFCAIPNSNMTNTLSHIHTKSHSESTSTDTSRKWVVWVRSGAGWAEHACRKPRMFVCRILLAGHAEPAGTGKRQLKDSPSYPAALTDAHWGPSTTTTAQLQGTILAQSLKTNTHLKKATVVHILTDNSNPAPMTNTFVPE